jgi:hypothetical protein
MNVYTDESGDLGWTFNRPYRSGGSSRFFTIAHLLVPKAQKHIPKRLVKDMYKFMSWHPSQELKASNLKPAQRLHLAGLTVSMMSKYPDIKVIAMTVRKENVHARFHRDSNKLYNYMIRLALLEHIKKYPCVGFVTDRRPIKVASGNSMSDYLQTILWTDLDADTVLDYRPVDSKDSLNIQFIDFMANLIWRSHELGESEPLKSLSKFLLRKTLFF